MSVKSQCKYIREQIGRLTCNKTSIDEWSMGTVSIKGDGSSERRLIKKEHTTQNKFRGELVAF